MSEQLCPECGLPYSAKPGEPHCIVRGGDNCRLRTIARLKAVNAELEAALVAADRMISKFRGDTVDPRGSYMLGLLADYDTAKQKARR